MSLPRFDLEMHQVVPLFVEAVLREEESDDLAAMLVPNRNVDLAYRLFGYVPLYFLLGGHLRCEAFAMPRMGQHQETGEVRRLSGPGIRMNSGVGSFSLMPFLPSPCAHTGASGACRTSTPPRLTPPSHSVRSARR
jgi:hypothetical protein